MHYQYIGARIECNTWGKHYMPVYINIYQNKGNIYHVTKLIHTKGK